ncbi:MAG: hypothetical protein NZ927_06555 [Candidatus Calescibacterium sp.]|nr:hypothetical protein [Candidatus Calescibacterium sp.]MCX7734062.1 hypothetical protein [bacterium]MDW8087057.1 nitrilase-related carbon-nitrogen hydrolase [Candidatus Calescibacterium sp.]
MRLRILFSLVLVLFFCSQKDDKKKGASLNEFRTHGDEKIAVIFDFNDNLDASKTVRFFAVGHRFDLKKDVVDEESYYQSYKKYMEIIKPYISKRYKNVVVFEEHAGLPLVFFGENGRNAREQAKSVLQASILLMGKIGSAISYYTDKFPEIDGMQGRQIFLALTDTLWRVFYNTFSSFAKEYGVYVVSCQNTPYPYLDKKNFTSGSEKFVDPVVEDKSFYYEATTSDVWNTCFIFSPQGDIVHKTRKVNLVPTEKNDLQFSSSSYEELEVYRIPETPIDVCIGISLDAFVPEYIRTLDEKGCDVLLQPDANSGAWAGLGGLKHWQTYEWLASTMGSIQTEYYVGCTNPHIALFEGKGCQFRKIDITWKKSIAFNVNPMMTGNMFDTSFDGQTAILGRDKRARRDINYIGNPPLDEIKFDGLQSFKDGGFIILGPWTFDIDKNLPIEEQRKKAVEYQSSLSQGGSNENMYISTVIGTDISLD